MNSLQRKKAVVTGGSKGIGLAVAQALAAEGADVVICGRNREQLGQAIATLRQNAGERKVVAHVTDVSDSRQVAELFEFVDRELGALDILVNNAGIGLFRAAGELSVDEWNRIIATNL